MRNFPSPTDINSEIDFLSKLYAKASSGSKFHQEYMYNRIDRILRFVGPLTVVQRKRAEKWQRKLDTYMGVTR